MKAEILTKIETFIEENQDRLFHDISRLVAVNSVEKLGENGTPFGEGPKKALEEALTIADELGLDTRNCEDKIGFASVGGDGERYLATITHVDVVPAGNGWKADPFVMRDVDGYILGRGVLDDKGPSVVCLYALKFIKELGMELKYPIRALLGANEETGMRDVEHYLDNYPAPLFCFSPDADFPLICGEKGIWHGRMISNSKADAIVEIKGGVAVNAIPDLCEATIKADHLVSTADVDAVQEGEFWHLTAHGTAGHASMPEGTKNAIGIMLEYILSNDLVRNEEKAFLEAALRVHRAWDGSLIDIAAQSEGFTPLTIVSGMIGIENGIIWQSLDSRYVPSITGEEILQRLRNNFGDAAKVECLRNAVPFYKAPDSAEIIACMDAFHTVTGSDAKPFTIGGGTYSRDFPNAVAFGPEYHDRQRPDFVGSIHGAEEGASKAELLEALKIYILALINLEEVDF